MVIGDKGGEVMYKDKVWRETKDKGENFDIGGEI
jgi:hypothetical protein